MKSIRRSETYSDAEIRDLLTRAEAKGFDLSSDELNSTTIGDLEALVYWRQ